MTASTMTLDEMRRIVGEANESAYWIAEGERRKWAEDLRAKANAVVAQLREQLAPQILQDLLDLSETPLGADYLLQALHPEGNCLCNEIPF